MDKRSSVLYDPAITQSAVQFSRLGTWVHHRCYLHCELRASTRNGDFITFRAGDNETWDYPL